MKTISFFVGLFGLWAFGNAAWILAVVNFLWMLFRGTTLFPWAWVIIAIGAFCLSLVDVAISVVILDK